MPKSDPETDTSRVSITAYQTGYTWVKNGLSHKAFSTIRGRAMYTALTPVMWCARNLLGVTDLETRLLQRHLMIDHLLRRDIEEKGLKQVLEIGCGFSPRGFKFMQEYGKDGLKYVEADLPAMAAEKKAALLKAGLLGSGHEVVFCNILEKEGESSLESTIQRHFDPNLPLAVITEGVTCYFDAPTISAFWRRLANILKGNPQSVYFTDNNQNIPGPGRRIYLLLWKGLVGITVRGRMHFHFDSDQKAKAAFHDAGFSRVSIHAAKDFQGRVFLPKSSGAEHMNIIEARP